MNNPLRILQTLDRHLVATAEITLFGRAALALGYAAGPAAFAATHDVDAILPLAWLAAEDENLALFRREALQFERIRTSDDSFSNAFICSACCC